MKNSDWFWKGIIYWFLLINILHTGTDGRRYDKCSTPDGREGVCVVIEYCREARNHHLVPCDEDGNYCCPKPPTHRSAQPQSPSSPKKPNQGEEPPPRRTDDFPGYSTHNDQFPRKPVYSYGGPAGPPPKSQQDGDKQHGRPTYDDDHQKRPQSPTAAGGKVKFEDSPSQSHDDRPTRNDHPSRGLPPHSEGNGKPDHAGVREEVHSSSGQRDRNNGGRRPPSVTVNDQHATKYRNQTDRPSHYPSRDPEVPFNQDHRPSRTPKPPRTQTNGDSGVPNKFVGPHEPLPHQPKVPACGVKPYELFIAGGEASEPHQWPWMTAIFKRQHSSGPKVFLCGGSLINTKYVLTAAHCFVQNYVILPASSFVVRLGSHYLNSGEEYTVSNFVIHENHTGSEFFNDIALVRLASEVFITDKIAPICLPFREMMHENLVDRIATVTGWGDTTFRTVGARALQQVSVPIVSSDECLGAYSRVRGAAFLAKGSDHVICAGLREGGKDACVGDSGGPLMLKISEDRWVVVGIVSFGYKCAEPGYPGVYTRVTSYKSWIQSHMKRY